MVQDSRDTEVLRRPDALLCEVRRYCEARECRIESIHEAGVDREGDAILDEHPESERLHDELIPE